MGQLVQLVPLQRGWRVTVHDADDGVWGVGLSGCQIGYMEYTGRRQLNRQSSYCKITWGKVPTLPGGG
jgi:hypothetical protein